MQWKNVTLGVAMAMILLGFNAANGAQSLKSFGIDVKTWSMVGHISLCVRNEAHTVLCKGYETSYKDKLGVHLVFQVPHGFLQSGSYYEMHLRFSEFAGSIYDTDYNGEVYSSNGLQNIHLVID